MQAGPWLESFGWGTDELVSPEVIYPAVSAEAPAAAAAAAPVGAAQGPPVPGKGASQEPPAGSKGAAPTPGKKRKAAGAVEETAAEAAAAGGVKSIEPKVGADVMCGGAYMGVFNRGLGLGTRSRLEQGACAISAELPPAPRPPIYPSS